jgi:hypothetical protein
MSVMDAFIPEGALKPVEEAHLMKELTDILVSLEGVEPENERARAASVIFVHRPTVVVAAGHVASPRYRFVPFLAKGRDDDSVLRLVEKAVIEAVARAEGSSFDDARSRVWVSPWAVPSPEYELAVDSTRILGSLADRE